jgi:hypothetical protein
VLVDVCGFENLHKGISRGDFLAISGRTTLGLSSRFTLLPSSAVSKSARCA